jgi:apolipoprotein N-acyltransferase
VPTRRLSPSILKARLRAAAPTPGETLATLVSALLLILAFPDFGLWPLAWVALVPLLLTLARPPRGPQAFALGWLWGTAFFYGSCYWLTYPIIHYAGLPAWVAYPLFLPAPLIAGIFPGLFALALARLCSRWGGHALLLSPILWASFEWARLGVVGQLWNAVGYSQAYVPALIQGARYGGVYLVGFLVVAVNAALAYALLVRRQREMTTALVVVITTASVLALFNSTPAPVSGAEPQAIVVALQPNVIPDFERPPAEHFALTDRHFELSERALLASGKGRLAAEAVGDGTSTAVGDEAAVVKAADATLDESEAAIDNLPRFESALPRVVIWPESPMNFSWGRNRIFRERVADFTRRTGASLLFNSLEPAQGGGGYNAAVLVDRRGRLAVQYDKIRLLPFGEYVPLPAWMPGASAVSGVVGDFTPGTRYALMPLGEAAAAPQAGVFICIESAYPEISREFARRGADVLVNITNDAYQGDTAVMRQHLANAVFRAVETGRTLLRVTNTGITARVSPRGEVSDATDKFQTAARVWAVAKAEGGATFYTKFGDLFVLLCAGLTIALVALTARPRQRRKAHGA